MTRMELPVISPCVGCGNCCRSIGLPPFEVANPDLAPQRSERSPGGCFSCAQVSDMNTFAAMPTELRAAHAQMLRDLKTDPSGAPCAWLDPASGRCVNYDHRPAVCRVFVVGSPECLHLRTGIPKCVWQDNTSPEVWRNPRSKERYEGRKLPPLTRWQRIRKWIGRNVGSVERELWKPTHDVVAFVRFLPRFDVELRFWSVQLRRRVRVKSVATPEKE